MKRHSLLRPHRDTGCPPRAVAALAALVGLAGGGCPEDVPGAPIDVVDGEVADGADGGVDGADGGAVDGDATTDTGPENPCKIAGGICVASTQACTSGSGTVAASGASGCVFDDGAGACCVPPAAQPTGDTCPDRGGLCAPIAGCNFVDGAFAPPSGCTGVINVCCLPETICGPETVVCCGPGDAADFRPACDRGVYHCDAFPGTTLLPIADCH